jgi:hypothetical protein
MLKPQTPAGSKTGRTVTEASANASGQKTAPATAVCDWLADVGATGSAGLISVVEEAAVAGAGDSEE